MKQKYGLKLVVSSTAATRRGSRCARGPSARQFFLRSCAVIGALALSGCVQGSADEAARSGAEPLCASPTLSVTPTGVIASTGVVQLQATASCASGQTAQYAFRYRREGDAAFADLQPYGSSNTAIFSASGKPSGRYEFSVLTRASGTTVASDASASTTALVGAVCNVTNVTAPPGPPPPPNSIVNVAATATCTGGATPEFLYYYNADGANALTPLGTWQTGPLSWQTQGLPSGRYRIYVYARAVGNQSGAESSDFVYFDVGNTCYQTTASANPPSSPAGGVIALSGAATCSGGAQPQYKFEYRRTGTSTNTLLRDWGAASFNWNTAGVASGRYDVTVSSRGVGSTSRVESSALLNVTIGEVCNAISMTQLNFAIPPPIGTQIPVSAQATCTSGTAEYAFGFMERGGVEQSIRTWATSPSTTWNTANLASGVYNVNVYTRRVGSAAPYEALTTDRLDIGQVCFQTTLQPTPTSVASGAQIPLSASTTCTGGTPIFRYFYRAGTAVDSPQFLLRDWGPAQATFDTSGLPTGGYTIIVQARNQANNPNNGESEVARVFYIAAQPLPGDLYTGPSLECQTALEPSTPVRLTLGLPTRNDAELAQRVADLSDPTSPNFRHFIDDSELTERYSVSDTQYQATISWAAQHGLDIVKTWDDRMLLSVSGPSSAVEGALHVQMKQCTRPDGSTYHAPAQEPTADIELFTAAGLNDRARSVPGAIPGSCFDTCGGGLTGTGLCGNFNSNDFRNAFASGPAATAVINNARKPATGAGQTVGIFALGTPLQSDIAQFKAAHGITGNMQLIRLGGAPDAPSGFNDGSDDLEVTSDIEAVWSMAPEADIVVVTGPNGWGYGAEVFDALRGYRINGAPVQQVTTSWFTKLDDTTKQVLVRANALGIATFAASGDDGSYLLTPGDHTRDKFFITDAIHIGAAFIQESPLVTAVGGTNLTMVGGARSFESVWESSTGGFSPDVPLPWFQAGLFGPQKRGLPDVAMPATNFENVFQGKVCHFGGTSLSAPLWAGFMALINQANVSLGGHGVGPLNPQLYALAKGPMYASSMHDIASGTIEGDEGFSAAPGYDLASGWGTPRPDLIAQLARPNPLMNTFFSRIEFDILTGDDNLGDNDSGLDFDLVDSNGNVLHHDTLKPRDGSHWQNSDRKQIFSTLSPTLRPWDIQSIVFHMSQKGCDLTPIFPDAACDNWTAEDVKVTLDNGPGTPSECLVHLKGTYSSDQTPALRMGKNNNTAEVAATSICAD